ncbi:helix-turn-helix transcriptional regulator [Pantoea ananatis]|uniref:helix-turn-helix transcriptional regulator n=1 Tax=Pantoea ananas TaxID=553 RepID=UPI0032EED650
MDIKDIEGNPTHLSECEATIIWYIITGMTSRSISNLMDISEKMISYYKLRAMRKLKVKNNIELSMWLKKKFNKTP